MAGIILEINVDDKGTVKVKQFADESKKAFKEMTDGPKAAQGPLTDLKEGWMAITAKVAIATAAFYAAKRMIYDNAVQIASATNEIEKQAGILGISTDELQKWQYAAKMSDVNAQELAIGIKMLSRNMEDATSGSSDAAKYFSAMGISVKTTERHLRPLNEVMGDIMDKFASWEDGPRKIAIAMQLFGRSGETLIPLLNKGRTGFNELAEEARKLGIILDPELIKKGSAAEDMFKKINEQLRVAKLNWAPAALEVAKFSYGFLESVNIIKKWMDDNKTVVDFMTGVLWVGSIPIKAFGAFKKKAEEIKAEAMMAWEPGPTLIPKEKPPEVGGKSEIDIVKEIQAAIEAVIYAEEQRGILFMARHELMEGAWIKERENQENLHRIEMDRAQQLADDMFPAEDKVRGIIEKGNENYEKNRVLLFQIQQLVKDFGWEDFASGAADASNEATRAINQMGQGAAKEAEEMQKSQAVVDNIVTGIANTWTSSFSTMRRSGEEFSDWFKGMWLDMADYAIGQIQKMIANYLLLGSVSGQTGGTSFFGTSAGGWGGILGGALSLLGLKEGGVMPGPWKPIHAFQEGGLIDRPTFGMIGEGGPEAVIPLKGGKIPIEGGGGGQNYMIYISSPDPISWLDFVRRNPAPFIEVIQKNMRKRGKIQRAVRSYG